ncbi:MAG UNVERIFIED_CONTAM: triose-phosphate isomerase [Rickettsiaceae bacterium]|jgi:triosephosphate isomerase
MTKLIIANWKTYLTLDDSIKLCNSIDATENLIIAPSNPYIALLASKFPQLNFAGQDVSALSNVYGAYTGESHACMLKDIGVGYAILGHSERRSNKLDDSKNIAKKLVHCLESSVIPIICIGENIEDRKSGRYKEVILSQLNEILSSIATKSDIIIAYEPFWSVGTGVLPSLDEISEIAELIRNNVKFLDNRLFLVYGGSINAKNALALMDLPNIDGFLIGKAATDIQELKAILDFNKL